jgi:hypothetical protein
VTGRASSADACKVASVLKNSGSIASAWVSTLPSSGCTQLSTGPRTPSRTEYDVIVQCLNEQLRELGVSSLVRYGDEIDL